MTETQEKILSMLKNFHIQCSKEALPKDEASLDNLYHVLDQIRHHQFMEKAKVVFEKMEKTKITAEENEAKSSFTFTQAHFNLLSQHASEIAGMEHSISALSELNSFSNAHLSVLIENRKLLNQVQYSFIRPLEKHNVSISATQLNRLFAFSKTDVRFKASAGAFSTLGQNEPPLLAENSEFLLNAPLRESLHFANLVCAFPCLLSQPHLTALQEKSQYLPELFKIFQELSKTDLSFIEKSDPVVSQLIQYAEHHAVLLKTLQEINPKKIPLLKLKAHIQSEIEKTIVHVKENKSEQGSRSSISSLGSTPPSPSPSSQIKESSSLASSASLPEGFFSLPRSNSDKEGNPLPFSFASSTSLSSSSS